MSGATNLTLEFEEPEITRYIGSAFQGKTIFTAKIDPILPEKFDSQHQAFLYDKVSSVADDDDRVFNKRQNKGFFAAKFKNLKPGRNYRVTLSSFLNGTIMGETSVSVSTRPEAPEDLDYKWKFDFSNSDIQFRLEMRWSPANKFAKGKKAFSSKTSEKTATKTTITRTKILFFKRKIFFLFCPLYEAYSQTCLI